MTTGSDLNDFVHGYLNYQIEHHLWPDLPMLKYRQAHRRVQEIAARHDIPFAKENVLKRVARTIDIAVGKTSMRRSGKADAALRKPAPASERLAQFEAEVA